MTPEAHGIAALLACAYGAEPVALRLLRHVPERVVYRVDRADRPPWLVHVGAATTTPEAYAADAATLLFLEHHRYPAPRVVSATDGAAVLRYEGRPVLVTTFVIGAPLQATPTSLQALGQTLGWLHTLRLPPASGILPPLRPAGMLPASELAFAGSELDAIRAITPKELRPRFAVLAAACHDSDWCAELPSVLIHNDCHPGNSVCTETGEVVLIDWEGAGLGPAIIDLGFLLMFCAVPITVGWGDSTATLPWHPQQQPSGCLDGVIAGYCREHMVSPAELDRLTEAMRFRAVVAAACAFASQVRRNLPDDPCPWWWTRYEAAPALADQARAAFDRLGPRR